MSLLIEFSVDEIYLLIEAVSHKASAQHDIAYEIENQREADDSLVDPEISQALQVAENHIHRSCEAFNKLQEKLTLLRGIR